MVPEFEASMSKLSDVDLLRGTIKLEPQLLQSFLAEDALQNALVHECLDLVRDVN